MATIDEKYKALNKLKEKGYNCAIEKNVVMVYSPTPEDIIEDVKAVLASIEYKCSFGVKGKPSKISEDKFATEEEVVVDD